MSEVTGQRSIVVYAGRLPCPLCGQIAVQFAHLQNGHVYAKHELVQLVWERHLVRQQTREWTCEVQ